MINRSKQNWQIGSTVRVGFMQLVVKAAIPTPDDFRPDQYLLTNAVGDKLYAFTPHHGLQAVTVLEAREMLADAKVQADRIAAQAIADAQRSHKAIVAINELLFADVA